MLRHLAIGVLLAALVPAFAHARESGTRVVVRFAPQVSTVEASRLTSAMRAQLGETARVTIEADTTATSSDCVVEVDRSDAGLVLHMTDGSGHTAGRTRFVAHGGELGASEAASIVRGFVLAATKPAVPSLDDETHDEALSVPATQWIAALPPPTRLLSSPGPERDRATTTRSPAPWRARVAVLYTGTTYALELPWQSGARLEGAYAFFPGVYGGLTYALHPAAELSTESAPVRVSRHSGALFAGIERGRTWAIGADAAVGLEGTMLSSTSAAVLTGAGLRVAPVFALRLHGRWRVPGGRGAALDVAPALELAPGRRRLEVESAASSTQLDFSVARFRVDVGGTYDLF